MSQSLEPNDEVARLLRMASESKTISRPRRQRREVLGSLDHLSSQVKDKIKETGCENVDLLEDLINSRREDKSSNN